MAYRDGVIGDREPRVLCPEKLAGIRPLYVQADGTLWASRSSAILRSTDHAHSFEDVVRFVPDVSHTLGDSFRIACRLLRTGFHSFLPLSTGDYLGIVKGHILLCSRGENKFKKIFRFRRGSRPLNICATPDGRLYFGEYFSNREREAVYIYGSEDHGKTWEPVYTFSRGNIRHVHGVYYDPYRSGCWILTGDEGRECKLLFTANHFRTVEVVKEGDQSVRAVGVLPMPDALIVPMDSPLETSYIQRMDMKTCALEKLCRLPGSALAVGTAGPYLLVSSGVEPSKVNRSKESVIFISKNGVDWRILHRGKKDMLPGKLFQYGLFNFPGGQNHGPLLYAWGVAVADSDNCMLSWNLEDVENALFADQAETVPVA